MNRLGLLKEMLEVVNRQNVLIKEGTDSSIDGFDKLAKEFDTLANKVEECLCGEYGSIEKDLLGQIFDLHTENTELYKIEFNRLKQEIIKNRTKGRASNAYGNSYDASREEGIFFDKK